MRPIARLRRKAGSKSKIQRHQLRQERWMERSRSQTKLWLSITRARSATAFCGPPRIVKLIGHAESPNAAHGGHALIPGREPAILAPEAFAAVIVGAPRIRIVRQSIGGLLRQHRYDNSESRHKLGSKAHLSLLVLVGITPLGHHPFMWPGTRGSRFIRPTAPRACRRRPR
jgi:hypothetical protein